MIPIMVHLMILLLKTRDIHHTSNYSTPGHLVITHLPTFWYSKLRDFIKQAKNVSSITHLLCILDIYGAFVHVHILKILQNVIFYYPIFCISEEVSQEQQQQKNNF